MCKCIPDPSQQKIQKSICPDPDYLVKNSYHEKGVSCTKSSQCENSQICCPFARNNKKICTSNI